MSWEQAWAEVAHLFPVVAFLAAVLVISELCDADGLFRYAGALMAAWGVPPVLAFNAACTLVLLAWRRPSIASAQRERFLPALRSGARYVRHEPHVCTILVRVVLFVAPATALWALLTKGVGGGP